MSLYHETAELLNAPTHTGGSLKSRIFSKKDLKSPPAQIYALAIESCKWSPILREVIEHADILRLERKLTPILSLLLVHDFLLAKKGIALPATHGLRSAVERHKARLLAEFTKARIRRKLSTIEAFKSHVEEGLEDTGNTLEVPYPRWIRINTLKTSLEDQLDTTFAGLERATTVDGVRHRGSKRLFLDEHIPNLVAISPSIDLSRSDVYKSGAIIFQDKASCFPAYLLDPLTEDGDIIDSCSAPGNKTTHIAAILLSHSSEPDECMQVIHAFEKNKGRAETLEKMVNLAGSQAWTQLHAGQDFLKVDPASPAYKNVGALLLDPSCSGSGIVGRDDMPQLHLPVAKGASQQKPQTKNGGKAASGDVNKKRKRQEEELNVMVDDDGEVTAVNTEDELKARLAALSEFQTQLLVHAFKFPAARKITYSTCSIHADENELVVRKALESAIAKENGWRIQQRADQIRGMRDWPVRGLLDVCENDEVLAEACIRANKGDEYGTMGFFLAGFVRDLLVVDMDDQFLRDEQGHMVRDMLGFPVRKDAAIGDGGAGKDIEEGTQWHAESGADTTIEEGEWQGFTDEVQVFDTKVEEQTPAKVVPKEAKQTLQGRLSSTGKRPQFGIKNNNKRKKK